MCGIFISVYPAGHQSGSLDKKAFGEICEGLRKYNAYRGPDYHSNVVINLYPQLQAVEKEDTSTSYLTAEFYASELRLRGDDAVKQPHEKDGNVLCWNGEVFGGLEVAPSDNDGVKLMERLCSMETSTQIRDLLGSIEGPYAFGYYQKSTRRFYFARDPLGRRSLLIHKPSADFPSLLISSVSSGSNPRIQFEEVPTDCIYCLELSHLDAKSLVKDIEKALVKVPRGHPGLGTGVFLPYASACRINDSAPPEDLPQLESLELIPDHLLATVNTFLEILDNSVFFRVKDIPRISDRTGAARVSILFSGGIDSTVLTYLAHKHIPLDEPIDLLNVGFENPRKVRILREGNFGALPKRQKREGVAIKNATLLEETSYMVPDRITGLRELEELRHLCPGRVWNFVEINIPYEESQHAREIVETLMLPSRTVMDLSLALALYFASRGRGQIRNDPSSPATQYTSPARVVLSGLGSDELLGGYGRHRTAYTTGGWHAVIEELQLELDRIPQRNLGRDDRVISTHGKETRHPFLSLDVVSFLAKLPIHYKMDPRSEIGKGDKMLLRLLARKLGLVEASSRRKRAMQFGSHSARMDGERRGDVDLAGE